MIRHLLLIALVPTLAEAGPSPPTKRVGAPTGEASTSTTTEPAHAPTADEVDATVSVEAAGAPAADRERRKREMQLLEARMFKLRDGGLFELAWCDPLKPASWSMYTCWAVNVARQDGRWAGGELVTVGARYRPGRGPVAILAGGGAGLLTMIADAFICGASDGFRDGSGGRASQCKARKLIPFELAAELGVRTAVSAGRLGVEVQILARYHANINGDGTAWIGRVPAGPMISAGASLMF